CYVYGILSECDKIQREEGSFFLTNVRDLQENIGGTKTSGIDFAIAYDYKRPFGRFRHSLEGQWLLEYTNKFPGFEIEGKGNYDIIALPELKSNFSTVWSYKSYNAGVNVRYINAFKECENSQCNNDEDMDKDGKPDALSRKIDLNVTA